MKNILHLAVCFTKKNKKTKHKKHSNKAIKRWHKKIEGNKFFSINFYKKGKVFFTCAIISKNRQICWIKQKLLKMFFLRKKTFMHSLNLINSSITSKQ